MPSFSQEWLNDYERKRAVKNRNTGPVALLECNLGNAALATPQAKEGDPERILVSVTSIRTRLLDEDNLCEKYHVDCCRYAGLIPNDSPDKIKIEVSQRKAVKGESERTEITITGF